MKGLLGLFDQTTESQLELKDSLSQKLTSCDRMDILDVIERYKDSRARV